MSRPDPVLLKLDMTLMFIDAKVFFLFYMFFDVYRETVLGAEVLAPETLSTKAALHYVWSSVFSPYIKWIPIVIVFDFFLKRAIKSFIH